MVFELITKLTAGSHHAYIIVTSLSLSCDRIGTRIWHGMAWVNRGEVVGTRTGTSTSSVGTASDWLWADSTQTYSSIVAANALTCGVLGTSTPGAIRCVGKYVMLSTTTALHGYFCCNHDDDDAISLIIIIEVQ